MGEESGEERVHRVTWESVLNADDAAMLFDDYNEDPMSYRVAVHRAATWIRDELFRAALEQKIRDEKDRIAFTAGSNAAGKSTATEFTGANRQAQIVFDSTLSNPEHARRLVDQSLAAGRRISILYIRRPLDDAFQGMLSRADTQKRVVTIQQLVGSDRGSAETTRTLWDTFKDDPRFAFQFVNNSRSRLPNSVLLSLRRHGTTLE